MLFKKTFGDSPNSQSAWGSRKRPVSGGRAAEGGGALPARPGRPGRQRERGWVSEGGLGELGCDLSSGLVGQAPTPASHPVWRRQADAWPRHSCPRGPPRATVAESWAWGDDSGDVESLQSPEIEASRSLAELFEKAVAHLQGLVQVASREQLLYLYARYKQVKVGNCNTPKPSFFDFEGKQKWEAWKALGDSSPSQAMQEYIDVVKKLDPSWNPQVRLNDYK